ncbi:hypothetical protein V1527DRAFT_473248 [Lipomyces starkeyi]
MFAGADGQAFRSCHKCRNKRAGKNHTGESQRAGFDLDECYDTHEEFVEAVSVLWKQHDDHKFDLTAQPLKIKATVSSPVCVDNDVAIGACAVTTNIDLQRRAAMLLRSDIFDCSGYYFHLRHAHERRDGAKYSFGCPTSVEHRPAESDLSTIQRFSKANASATVIYEHVGHTESRKFHMTDEVQNYIKSHKYLPPRQIYRNMIQMTNVSDFEKPEAHIITRKQVYNFCWLSLTHGEWHRTCDLSKWLKKNGYERLQCLQEPGISLAFLTPSFTDSQKFSLTPRSALTSPALNSTASLPNTT